MANLSKIVVKLAAGNKWSEQDRYQHSITQFAAQELYDAVTENQIIHPTIPTILTYV
ncbi:hypothetical protein [Candidatus Parabeggiatoa sp. HSG14]|uniref:hypothetical protein n=1 Tax=Candidatus Parabeggiatoa sp. HSG14 TaxID=3055593 RepID=UPI0025A7989A|nr:hypothetical protein [Thiotrichales bacterium HSG14]